MTGGVVTRAAPTPALGIVREQEQFGNRRLVMATADIAALLGRKENDMTDSVYKVIELVGTSTESWEKAAATAVEMASKTLRDLRIAEVVELDMQLEGGKVLAYRAKVKISFKYQGGD